MTDLSLSAAPNMEPDILGLNQTCLLSCNYPFVKPTADAVLYADYHWLCITVVFPATTLPFVNYILTSFLYSTNILQEDMTVNIAHTKDKKCFFSVSGIIGKSHTLKIIGCRLLAISSFCCCRFAFFFFYYSFHFTSAAVLTALPANKSGLWPICLSTSALSLLSKPRWAQSLNWFKKKKELWIMKKQFSSWNSVLSSALQN